MWDKGQKLPSILKPYIETDAKKGIYRPRNMFLLKNLQFLPNHYETRG